VEEHRRRALEQLARQYWQPIHAYLCAALRQTREDAEDLAQGFFTWTLERDFFARADPTRGRFRAFLKVALRHYVVDLRRREQATRRGGAQPHQSLTPDPEESPTTLVDPQAARPEEVLDSCWRQELLRTALQRTQDDLCGSGRATLFAVFRDYYLEAGALDYKAVAQRHDVSTTDVSNYLSRSKRVYRQHLKNLVVESVQRPEDLQEELDWLFGSARA
jgi:RNA polymerase sigma-70 factor (ECF subfamily)